MGTRLRNASGEVWPNTALLAADPYDFSLRVLGLQADGRTPADPNDPRYTIIPSDIIRTTFEGDVYQSLIETLARRGYRECAQPASVCPEGRLFVLPYDWRRDLGEATVALDQLVSRVRQQTGAPKVHLLAHSMGGLVARSYIATPERAANIDTLITLGTPYFGAPKAFHAIRYGTCLFPAPLGTCWLNRQRLKEVAQNFPAIYQLVPTPGYFDVYPNGHVLMERDFDRNGTPDGRLSYAQVNNLLAREHNAALTARAADFHGPLTGYQYGTNGVRVYVVVGSGRSTPGEVREYLKRTWYNPFQSEIAYDVTLVNGDETVPLGSADLGRSSGRGAYSGSVNIIYTGLSHGDLARGAVEGSVISQVIDRFEQPYLAERLPRSGDDQEGQNPVPLVGYQMVLQGDARLEVADDIGNVVRITPDGVTETEVPSSTLTRLDDTTSIFVPPARGYEVRVLAETEGFVDLRLRMIDEATTEQTIVFKDVAISATTVARLVYPGLSSTRSANYQLQIDDDRDGVFERAELPLAIVGANGSADTTPPTSTITLAGTRGSAGWFVGAVAVTLTAQDNVGGSGIARLQYSLDQGRTIQEYAGPITVSAETTPMIMVYAVDRAGNGQPTFTTSPIGPYQVALPVITQ
jgi:pimeloyl-ACP methyl ester carboxylesterase